MIKNNKKAFTLIELLAVIVVLAILSLIAVPMVLNTIRSARENSYKRSIEAYGRAVEYAVLDYKTAKANVYNNKILLSDLDIDYEGNNVKCADLLISDDDLILIKCYVYEDNDSNAVSNIYHYKNRKLIDRYDSYKAGDIVKLKGEDYNVLADTSSDEDTILLLKINPFTVDEINRYGIDKNGENHINQHYFGDINGANVVPGKSYDIKSDGNYGGTQFYSSSSCYVDSSHSVHATGCTNDYNKSEVKNIIDNWADDKIGYNLLVEYSYGYKARLITMADVSSISCLGTWSSSQEIKRSCDWLYNDNYWYWTMEKVSDSNAVYRINNTGNFRGDWAGESNVYEVEKVIKPVINVYKIVLEGD